MRDFIFLESGGVASGDYAARPTTKVLVIRTLSTLFASFLGSLATALIVKALSR